MEDTGMEMIDGSVLEGGGQILRIAISLSALLGKPIRVNNIRAGRSTPGLRPQHLCGLCLVRDIAKGTLEGAEIGSTEITFVPQTLSGGTFTADTRTAGSVGLLMQVAVPCMLMADDLARVFLKGGTNAEMAPQIDYIDMVLQDILSKFDVEYESTIERRGYYPKGGGEVKVVTFPHLKIKAAEIVDKGDVISFTGRAFVAGVLPLKMADEMASSATQLIQRSFPNVPINIVAEKERPDQAVGNGSGIIIIAETSTGCKLGGSALSKKGIKASSVGEAAATQLLDDLKTGACVDSFSQDQLIIYMAIAKGKSRIKTGPITLHTQTAIYVAEQLTGVKFNIIKEPDETSNIIECEGIGLIGKGRDPRHKCVCRIKRVPPPPEYSDG